MLGPVVRGPTSPKEASRVPSAQEPASPRGPNAPVRAAPTRGHDARGPVGAQLRPGLSPDPFPEREAQPGRRCGLARADLESHAPWGVRPRLECDWVAMSRGPAVPAATERARGSYSVLAFLPGPRSAPGAWAPHGIPGRPGCGRRPGSSSGTPTSPPRTPRCSPASPRRWPSSARTSHGGGPRWGGWRGSRTSARAPNLGPRTPRAVSGGVPLRPSRERGPSGGSHRGAPGPRPLELGSEGGSGQSETSGLADASPAPLLLRLASRTELLGCLALPATGGPAVFCVCRDRLRSCPSGRATLFGFRAPAFSHVKLEGGNLKGRSDLVLCYL